MFEYASNPQWYTCPQLSNILSCYWSYTRNRKQTFILLAPYTCILFRMMNKYIYKRRLLDFNCWIVSVEFSDKDKICLRGRPPGKNNCLLLTWEENILNKQYVSSGSKHSLFLIFCVKRKENDLHRKCTFLGGPAEYPFYPTISEIEQNLWFYFIYKG